MVTVDGQFNFPHHFVIQVYYGTNTVVYHGTSAAVL